MSSTQPKRQLLLCFRAAKKIGDTDALEFRRSVSAIEFADDGDTLFVGGDETIEKSPSIEQLTEEQGNRFDSHCSYTVDEIIELPDRTKNKGRLTEIDIEGLSIDNDRLWLVGSHSAKRSKPKPYKTVQENIERLADIEPEKNRFYLGYFTVETHGTTRKLTTPAARLRSSALIDTLRDDAHLGPVLHGLEKGSKSAIPGKDNGFDIEGLAVTNGRIFLGLRGPVLRGWAMILEIKVKPDGEDRLVLDDVQGKPYLKHFIDLRGLGVRDLYVEGNDLLILAGPTMNLDGPVAVFRYREILASPADDDTLTGFDSNLLEKVLDLPFGVACDHPEGMALLPTNAGDPREIVIVYDSPADERLVGETNVLADVFELPTT